MKLQNIFYIIIIAIMTASCEGKVVEFDLSDDASKLVIFGFISPGDTITNIYVSTTTPVVGKYESFEIIKNASVKIIHNQKEHTLNFDTISNSYTIHSKEFEIKGDETYTLKVSAKGYNEASSTITTLSEVNKTLEFVRFLKPNSHNNYESKVEVKWKDNPTKKNYYRLDLKIVDTIRTDHYSIENNLYYDDANWNGKEKYSGELNLYRFFSQEAIENGIDYEIALINVDKHYFLYHKKALEQGEYSDNPFAEPTIVYSNIENGVGVFCSYTKYVIRIKWKQT